MWTLRSLCIRVANWLRVHGLLEKPLVSNGPTGDKFECPCGHHARDHQCINPLTGKPWEAGEEWPSTIDVRECLVEGCDCQEFSNQQAQAPPEVVQQVRERQKELGLI